MSFRKNYLLNLETIAVYTNYFLGDEYAGVLYGKENCFVSQSPRTIIQNSFLEVGKDLEGAQKAARYLLQKKLDVPIVLSVSNNITLIQCKAACELGGEVWVVAKHIKSLEQSGSEQTLIHTTNGHTLTVDMKPKKLQAIRDRAMILREILLKNLKEQSTPHHRKKEYNGYFLIRENGKVNYQIKKKKKK